MNNKDNIYKGLLEKFAEGTLDSEGQNVLMRAVEHGKMDELISNELDLQWGKSLEIESDKAPVVPFDLLPIAHSIHKEKKPAQVVSLFSKPLFRYAIAASLAGIILFTGWSLGLFNFGAGSGSVVPEGLVQVENTLEGLREFVLPDGSQVSLEKGAVLHYPASFTGDVREVYLSGNAFFRIKHLGGQGFIVNAEKISAEVLGTSFWVHQDKLSGVSDVEVRTGKVKVSTSGNKKGSTNGEIVVLPNQQAIHNSGTTELKLALADSIFPLSSLDEFQPEVDLQKAIPSFLYKKASPIQEILNDFENAYGVSFTLKNQRIKHCLVSGDFSGGDFFKNLEIICLIIGAKYSIVGTTISIDGPGCAQ